MNKTKIAIIKLGGSVVTFKEEQAPRLREDIIREACNASLHFLNEYPNWQLVIVHGAGAHGHQIAKAHNLNKGTHGDKEKIQAALDCHKAIHDISNCIGEIAAEIGLPLSYINPQQIVTQVNGVLDHIDVSEIQAALISNQIPLLHGDMVLDSVLGYSVCSGDVLVSSIGKKLGVSRVLFATDVDGIYSEDPFKHKDAVRLGTIRFSDIAAGLAQIGESHNVDVTGGLRGKIQSLSPLFDIPMLEDIIFFNGLKKDRYTAALYNTLDICTRVQV